MHVEGKECDARTTGDARGGVEERDRIAAAGQRDGDAATAGQRLRKKVGDRVADAVVRAAVSRERSP
jgi:hypothetical protein